MTVDGELLQRCYAMAFSVQKEDMMLVITPRSPLVQLLEQTKYLLRIWVEYTILLYGTVLLRSVTMPFGAQPELILLSNRLVTKACFYTSRKETYKPRNLAILLNKDYGDDADNEEGGVNHEVEGSIPEFKQGEIIPLVNAKLYTTTTKISLITSGAEAAKATLKMKEKITTSPSHLSEAELIGLTEKMESGQVSEKKLCMSGFKKASSSFEAGACSRTRLSHDRLVVGFAMGSFRHRGSMQQNCKRAGKQGIRRSKSYCFVQWEI